MIGKLRRYVIRRKFQKMVEQFDRQIAAARAKHQPVKHIQQAKSVFVHQALERRA